MITNGFIKINLENFYSYLDKISTVVDYFYRNNKDESINFSLQNHKLIINQNESFINRIEIDHKSIFVNYNNQAPITTQIEYFTKMSYDIFKSLDYKPMLINRIGHAVHYVLFDDISSVINQMFTSKSCSIMSFNELTMDMKINDNVNMRKIISTPIDQSNLKKVLLINADYYTTNLEYKDLDPFLFSSANYFNDKNNILRGLND